MLTIRKIRPDRDAGIYIAMQVVGGVLGAPAGEGVLPRAAGALVNYGTPGISDRYLQGGEASVLAFLAEAVGAFLPDVGGPWGTAVNPTAPKGVAGAAIGGALSRSAWLIFAPAHRRELQPGAPGSGPPWPSGHVDPDAWLYILAPIAGAPRFGAGVPRGSWSRRRYRLRPPDAGGIRGATAGRHQLRVPLAVPPRRPPLPRPDPGRASPCSG